MVVKANYQLMVSNGANPNFISLLIVHPSIQAGWVLSPDSAAPVAVGIPNTAIALGAVPSLPKCVLK